MASNYPTSLDTLATNKTDGTATAGDHAQHHDDMADAINKVEAELGINPSGSYATVVARLNNVLPFSVKDYGAIGDGTTDDTAAIQACFVAAAIANAKVYFPPTTAFYKITDTILITRIGQVIEGSNGRYCEVKQTVANKDAFHVTEDLTNDPFTSSKKQKQMTFRNLRITGVGYATSTGAGVRLVGPVSGTWSGDAIYFDNVDILGFQWGLYIDSFGNVRVADTCTLHYNDTNIYCVQSAGQSNNSHHFGGQNVFAQTVGIDINAVCQGIVITCGDMGNQPKQIRFRDGGSTSTATIIGGDYENATGSEGHIDIESNWTVTAIGVRFLKGTEMEPYRIAASSALHIIGGNWHSYLATTALVLATSGLAEVTAEIPGVTNTNDARPLVNWNNLAKTGLNTRLPSRLHTFAPTATANYKGREYLDVGLDSTSVDDHIKSVMKKGGGISPSYAITRHTAVIEGTGSPNGAQVGTVGDLYINLAGSANATLYIKESGANTNTGWTAFATGTVGPSGPAGGLQVGDVHGRSFWKSGKYSVAPGTTQTLATLGNGNLRLYPFPVPYQGSAWTLTRIGAECTVIGDVGCTVRLGIYADDGSGVYPGALVLDAGTIDGHSATIQEITISQALTPGALYWIGGAVQGVTVTQPTMRCFLAPTWMIPQASITANSAAYGYNLSGVTGALPGTFTAGQPTATGFPRIHVLP